MEQTFSFTVKLSHPVYVALLNESKTREKSTGAVPSRTARQLIEERLEEINEVMPKAIPITEKITAAEEQPAPKSTKSRSRKRAASADEPAPTTTHQQSSVRSP